MNISCDKCGKRYVIADEKLAGKASAKIRCKQCQNLITFSVGSSSATAASPEGGVAAAPTAAPIPQSTQWDEEEQTRAMPALDLSATWFAMIHGTQTGPLDLTALKAKVDTGDVTLRTYLWKPGMADWKRASDVPEVSPVFAGVSVAHPPLEPAKARDEAVASQLPAPEVTTKRATPSGGTGAVVTQDSSVPAPRASNPAPLNDLFNDVSGELPKLSQQDMESTQADQDPFAALGGGDDKQLPPPGEATKFFIAQAGVNKRNPPWKIALFVVSIVALPVAVLWVLSTLSVIPPVTRVNEQGVEVQESFFSPAGISSLKDRLTGEGERKKQAAAAEAARKKAAAAAAAGSVGAGTPKDTTKPEVGGPTAVTPPKDGVKLTAEQMAALVYADETNKIGNTAIKDRNKGQAGMEVNKAGGLSDDAAMKTINQNIKGFNACIENALRRNPNLAVGNVQVVITVGTSGTVKTASVEPKKHEGSDWAQCMVSAAKRITFTASDGETELQVPFKVGVSM